MPGWGTARYGSGGSRRQRRYVGSSRTSQVFDYVPFNPDAITTNIFASAKGMEYQAWINDNSRTGAAPGNLNNELVYQIESIFRDVLFRESRLTAEAGTGIAKIVCADLLGNTNTYYDGAYVYNFTRNAVRKVVSYTAADHEIVVLDVTGQTTGDLFSVFNINADAQIDYATFDLVDAGKRSNWIGAFSIVELQDSFSLISGLAQEAGLVWTRNSLNKERIRTFGDPGLTEGTVTLTTADILEVGGVPQIKIGQTSPDEIVNDFTLTYRWDYAKGSPQKTLKLNPEESTLSDDSRTGYRDGITTYTALCAASFAAYKVRRPVVVDLQYIRETTTAEYKLKQLADLYAMQYLTVEADLVHNANTVQIEEGDFLKINHALLPAASVNTSYFIVTDWQEIPGNGTYHIVARELAWGT